MSGEGWGEENGCKIPPYEIGNYSVSFVNMSSVDLLITCSVKHFMELNKSRGRCTVLFAGLSYIWSIQVEIHCSRGCSDSTLAVQRSVSLSLEVFSALVGQGPV